MNRTLKWVLGILAVLVVLAVIAGAAWVWQNRTQMMAYRMYSAQPNAQATPGAPNGQSLPRGPHMFGYDYDDRGPMMGARRFNHMMPFMPLGMGMMFFGGLFRLIIPLGLVVLVAFIFYQLGKRSGPARTQVIHTEAPSPDDSSSGQNPPTS